MTIFERLNLALVIRLALYIRNQHVSIFSHDITVKLRLIPIKPSNVNVFRGSMSGQD